MEILNERKIGISQEFGAREVDRVIIVNVKINLTFTIINLFLLPCTSDDYVISVQIGTGKRNLFIAFTIDMYFKVIRRFYGTFQ